MPEPRRRRRGISPVIGTVLLLAIAVVVAAIVGYALLGVTGTHDPAPSVTVELVATEDPTGYVLRDRGRDTTLGNQTQLQGVLGTDTLHGRNFPADDQTELTPLRDGQTRVPRGRSYTLQTDSAEPVPELERISAGGVNHRCDWAETEVNDQGRPEDEHEQRQHSLL